MCLTHLRRKLVDVAVLVVADDGRSQSEAEMTSNLMLQT